MDVDHGEDEVGKDEDDLGCELSVNSDETPVGVGIAIVSESALLGLLFVVLGRREPASDVDVVIGVNALVLANSSEREESTIKIDVVSLLKEEASKIGMAEVAELIDGRIDEAG